MDDVIHLSINPTREREGEARMPLDGAQRQAGLDGRQVGECCSALVGESGALLDEQAGGPGEEEGEEGGSLKPRGQRRRRRQAGKLNQMSREGNKLEGVGGGWRLESGMGLSR